MGAPGWGQLATAAALTLAGPQLAAAAERLGVGAVAQQLETVVGWPPDAAQEWRAEAESAADGPAAAAVAT